MEVCERTAALNCFRSSYLDSNGACSLKSKSGCSSLLRFRRSFDFEEHQRLYSILEDNTCASKKPDASTSDESEFDSDKGIIDNDFDSDRIIDNDSSIVTLSKLDLFREGDFDPSIFMDDQSSLTGNNKSAACRVFRTFVASDDQMESNLLKICVDIEGYYHTQKKIHRIPSFVVVLDNENDAISCFDGLSYDETESTSSSLESSVSETLPEGCNVEQQASITRQRKDPKAGKTYYISNDDSECLSPSQSEYTVETFPMVSPSSHEEQHNISEGGIVAVRDFAWVVRKPSTEMVGFYSGPLLDMGNDGNDAGAALGYFAPDDEDRAVPHGTHGTIVFENGDRYDGPFDFGNMHGDNGVYTTLQGSMYNGAFLHNLKHGEGGDLVLSNHFRYRGRFEFDKPHGYGILYDPQGDIQFQGEWRYGKPALDTEDQPSSPIPFLNHQPDLCSDSQRMTNESIYLQNKKERKYEKDRQQSFADDARREIEFYARRKQMEMVGDIMEEAILLRKQNVPSHEEDADSISDTLSIPSKSSSFLLGNTDGSYYYGECTNNPASQHRQSSTPFAHLDGENCHDQLQLLAEQVETLEVSKHEQSKLISDLNRNILSLIEEIGNIETKCTALEGFKKTVIEKEKRKRWTFI